MQFKSILILFLASNQAFPGLNSDASQKNESISQIPSIVDPTTSKSPEALKSTYGDLRLELESKEFASLNTYINLLTDKLYLYKYKFDYTKKIAELDGKFKNDLKNKDYLTERKTLLKEYETLSQHQVEKQTEIDEFLQKTDKELNATRQKTSYYESVLQNTIQINVNTYIPVKNQMVDLPEILNPRKH